MKTALFLVLGLCTVMTASAQYGNGGNRNGNGYNGGYNNGGYNNNQRDDKWIDSDALENMALQRLDSAIDRFRKEAAGMPVITSTRGGPTLDLRLIVESMDRDVAALKKYTRGRRQDRMRATINQTFKSLDISASQLINAIPGLTRGSANLIDNVLAIVKAVGAVDLALDAPRSAGPYVPPVIEPKPPVYQRNFNGGYCSLSFSNWNDYTVSASGYDVSQATANTYAACSTVAPGSYGSVTNTQACQSKISNAKCVDIYDIAAAKDPYNGRFTACTMSFSNWNDYMVNAAGASMVEALSKLWDSCKNVAPGSYGSVTNAEACRKAFVSQKFSCTVQ